MTAGAFTFWFVTLALTPILVVVLYPGVRRHARSARDSLVATVMAALLAGTAAALVAAFTVNALLRLMGA